jgi:hypothetical protein
MRARVRRDPARMVGSMTIEKAIATVAVIGCLWLFSTAGIWGEWLDNLECGSPKVAKRVQL